MSISVESSKKRKHRGDVIVHLDQDDLDQYLPNWQQMKSPVKLEFLGRSTTRAVFKKHWAWLLKGVGFFCTIEYGDRGIRIQYFDSHRGIEAPCSAIMGDSDIVGYYDKFSTKMRFNDILREVTENLHSKYTTEKFQVFTRNCRHFVVELGKKMDPRFDAPNLPWISVSFPKSRYVGKRIFDKIHKNKSTKSKIVDPYIIGDYLRRFSSCVTSLAIGY